MLTSDRDSELAILAYLTENDKILLRYHHKLKDWQFRYPPAKDIFQVLSAAAEHYKQVPTYYEFTEMINLHAQKHGRVATDLTSLFADLDIVYGGDITPATGQKIRLHVAKRIAQDCFEKIVKANPNDLTELVADVQRQFREVSRVDSDDLWNPGFSLFSEHGIKKSIQMINQLYKEGTVPLGWDRLDRKLGGGLRQGEFALGMASTGLGKSLLLLNVASNLVPTGRRIVYYFTDNTLDEMAERISACITRRSIKYETREETEYHHALLHAAGGYNDNLIMVEWPPKTFSIPDIKEHIEEFTPYWAEMDHARGVADEECGKVDIILVDYLEEFGSGDKKVNDWEEVREAAVGCKKIAKTLKIPLFAVTQGNKESMKSEIHEMYMAGSSTQKMNPAAHVFILNRQNSYERREGKVMLMVPKTRRVDGNYVNPMLLDKGRQLLTEDPDQDIYPLQEISKHRKKLDVKADGSGNEGGKESYDKVKQKGEFKRERFKSRNGKAMKGFTYNGPVEG